MAEAASEASTIPDLYAIKQCGANAPWENIPGDIEDLVTLLITQVESTFNVAKDILLNMAVMNQQCQMSVKLNKTSLRLNMFQILRVHYRIFN